MHRHFQSNEERVHEWSLEAFEGLQGLLEADTERLHELAEAPMLMQATGNPVAMQPSL